jgi:gamma-glutamyltranspeptidase
MAAIWRRIRPKLSRRFRCASGMPTVYNMRPPTQGLASLLILGAFAKMECAEADGCDFVHLLVEASKQAFAIRDRHITDEDYMSAPPESFLTEKVVAKPRRRDRSEDGIGLEARRHRQ